MIEERDKVAEALEIIGHSLGLIALALTRMADAQIPQRAMSKVNFTTAAYEKIDDQTKRLREIAKANSAPTGQPK